MGFYYYFVCEVYAFLISFFRVLIYTTVVTPYRIAFVEEDSLVWETVSYFIDFLFFLDIVFSFFTANYNSDDDLIVDKNVIAIAYLKGWFFIDVVSIFPLSLVLDAKNYTQLARLTRLPKLYKLIKMTR